jgi:hypothetical protein
MAEEEGKTLKQGQNASKRGLGDSPSLIIEPYKHFARLFGVGDYKRVYEARAPSPQRPRRRR